MADQCIVCLETLDAQSSPSLSQLHEPPEDDLPQSSSSAAGEANASAPARLPSKSPLGIHPSGEDSNIAVIQICGHALHDACLREWTGKANSCPICRQAFHLVHVYDKVGGTQLSSYKVEDKKQVAEFDPQAWLDDNPEVEEEIRPCPICNRSDHEDVLLLCDSCDAPYHTFCVGLDSVPRGHWFCLECTDTGAELLTSELHDEDVSIDGFSNGRSGYLPRTQATMRRARQHARSNDWQGAWGQIAGRVWDALNLDLDNHDDDDALHNYRRSQQRREQDRREYQRWQQRLNIASRLGAREVFANNISNVLPQPVAQQQQPSPPPPEETPEEKQAWGALEKAMEVEVTNLSPPASNHRKRKSRSVTASPIEPTQQPERRLKRPRTRRAPGIEATSSNRPLIQTNQSTSNEIGLNSISPVQSNSEAPSFLSSLLKEVEMSAPSDDENVRPIFTFSTKAVPNPSSPVSPSPSAHSSPRALSATPPPRAIGDRPGSPLTLSSHIEPIYPPSNFLATLSNSDQSDSDSRSRHQSRRRQKSRATNGSPEIRQPEPHRRQQSIAIRYPPRSQDASPSRAALPFEMKANISGIVKDALKPHWNSGQITADQYASINRDLSHMLYKEVSEDSLDEDARRRFEKIASQEVTKAVADLEV
ncbi:uncharacterized protein GGS22DRAFT_51372 [Annulohypoxylon maeteangense]|uniref:uncharacterized protein n=1 Tax=Annulohypoxylon maeteangense TaxID=1927788 RepID=UPI002007661E|nr:uncharacterized protein GGS22DRAFT_51372 [Annulohypoxylon maeteangense]KAI0881843.1 hypothetical protein GGS22DRAFT_51372 [Annulohypoxylon maeteangense]